MVALAIQHLHAMKLIHCDIKPENVLLKSDPSKPVGFVTKLSDFGLAKMLRENYYIVNRCVREGYRCQMMGKALRWHQLVYWYVG